MEALRFHFVIFYTHLRYSNLPRSHFLETFAIKARWPFILVTRDYAGNSAISWLQIANKNNPGIPFGVVWNYKWQFLLSE